MFFLNWFQVQSIVLSSEARNAAAEIEQRLQLGSKLSDVVNNKDDVLALFNLYRDEGYILTEHKGRFCVSILAALFWIWTPPPQSSFWYVCACVSSSFLLSMLIDFQLYVCACMYDLFLIYTCFHIKKSSWNYWQSLLERAAVYTSSLFFCPKYDVILQFKIISWC